MQRIAGVLQTLSAWAVGIWLFFSIAAIGITYQGPWQLHPNGLPVIGAVWVVLIGLYLASSWYLRRHED